MGRILCIDYGLKRVGLAVTDELKIIASPFKTVNTSEIISFINNYIKETKVELIVVGLPFNLRGEETDATKKTLSFISVLRKKYPQIKLDTYDERYTSKIAKETILMMGKSKKFRQDKSNIDKVSASIILQSYQKRKGL